MKLSFGLHLSNFWDYARITYLLSCEYPSGRLVYAIAKLPIISYASGGINGVDAVGFRYWHDPGAFVNGFRGVASVFVFCATFYAGVESVAV